MNSGDWTDWVEPLNTVTTQGGGGSREQRGTRWHEAPLVYLFDRSGILLL